MESKMKGYYYKILSFMLKKQYLFQLTYITICLKVSSKPWVDETGSKPLQKGNFPKALVFSLG